MLKQTIKTTILSALLIQNLTADVATAAAHTFTDGAMLRYTPAEEKTEANDIVIVFPYLGEAKISGKAHLSKESAEEKYKIVLTSQLDPTAALEFTSEQSESAWLRNSDNGNLSVQISDSGESIQGTHVIANQALQTLKAEELEYSHLYKKADDKEDLYTNTVKVLVKNGASVYNIDTKDPFALQEIIKNPFSQFKELALNLSYISSKDIIDYRKGLDASFSGKGHHDFSFESTLKAELPFKDVQGGEKLEGFVYRLSIPVINLRVEGEEEKKHLKNTLERYIASYEIALEEHSNSFTDKLLASLNKNRDELIERHYKYFTEFSKDDIISVFLTLKGASASPEDKQPKILTLAALDLAVRKFNLKGDFEIDGDGAYKCVLSFPEPETSIKEFSRSIQEDIFLFEPILKDFGYLEAIQNGSNPEKLLSLLRQLSDSPQATGNAPLTITMKMDGKGASVGTLSMERAAQLVIGWALMAFPISIGQ